MIIAVIVDTIEGISAPNGSLDLRPQNSSYKLLFSYRYRREQTFLVSLSLVHLFCLPPRKTLFHSYGREQDQVSIRNLHMDPGGSGATYYSYTGEE